MHVTMHRASMNHKANLQAFESMEIKMHSDSSQFFSRCNYVIYTAEVAIMSEFAVGRNNNEMGKSFCAHLQTNTGRTDFKACQNIKKHNEERVLFCYLC